MNPMLYACAVRYPPSGPVRVADAATGVLMTALFVLVPTKRSRSSRLREKLRALRSAYDVRVAAAHSSLLRQRRRASGGLRRGSGPYAPVLGLRL